MGDRVGGLRRYIPRGGTLPDDVWRSRHRGILALLWIHAVAVPAFGLARQYSTAHVLAESLVLPSLAVAASIPSLGRRARTIAAALGLLSASGLLVHLSHGLIEMHFHFFIMVVVVSLYQDWIPFLAAIAYVLIHHGIVGAIDPRSVYNHPAAIEHPWTWAGIHALFIAGISAASLVSWRLNETYLAHRREAEERLRRIADASRQFLSSLDLDSVLQTLARLIVPAVADVCFVDVVHGAGVIKRMTPVGAAPYEDQVTELLSASSGDSEESDHVAAVVRSGRSLLVEEIPPAVQRRANDGWAGSERVEGLTARLRSAMAVPLVGRDGVIAVLTAGTVGSPGRVLTSDDLELVDELARRAAAAADNARLFAAQREAAETLQHSLLPESLPELPGIELGARYSAGGPGTDVGGDWYDVITLPDGSIGLVMGDVVGRGIPAASVMGQVRNALRAFAHARATPGRALTELNTMLDSLNLTDQMVTVCFGVFDIETGTFTIANAGHPPPAVVSVDGGCALLDEVAGVPLGVRPGTIYCDHTVTLRPGDRLMLYTDGLVEDRHTPLDRGIALLCETARTNREAGIAEFCDQVIADATGGRSIADDVALLVLRYVPFLDQINVTLPALPSILRPLRSALRRWLHEAGATDEETFSIVVAATEACSNVIRHATPSVRHFSLSGNRDGEVRIDVRDGGRWRQRGPSDIGGRGLPIIEEFVDEMRITKGPPETIVSMRRRLVATRED